MKATDLKTLAQLKEHAPEVYPALVAEMADATREVTEAKIADATSEVAAITSKLSEAEQKVRDLELEREGVAEANKDLGARIAKMEKDLATRDARTSVTKAIVEFSEGRPGGALILRQVMEDFDAGRVTTVEQARDEAARKASLVDAAGGHKPSSDVKPAPASDGGIAPEITESSASDDLADLNE